MSGPRRAAVTLPSVFAVLAAIIAISIPPAAARQDQGSLGLVGQTAFVPSEGTFQVVLSWTGTFDPTHTVGGLLFSPIADESEITEPPATPFAPVGPIAIGSLPRTPDGHLIIDIGIRSVEDGASDRLRLREAGVYPLRLDLRSADGATIASLRTNLIRLPTEAAEVDLLPISTVIEISSAEGLTLGPATELLGAHPELPLAVVLGDGVLTQLESDAEAATALRQALVDRPVIAAPSPKLDISALAEIGRSDLYLEARAATTERLRALGLTASVDLTQVDENLTIEGIDLLSEIGIRVIVDTGTNRRPTGVLEGTESALRVVQIDSTLTSAMGGRTRSIEKVHRLLAALSLRGSTDRSPIFIGGEALRDVPVGSIQLFLAALEQAGTIGSSSLVDAADASPLFPIRPDEQPTQNLLAVEDLILRATANIATYQSFYINGGLPPVVFERSLTDTLATGRNPSDRTRALEQLTSNLAARFDDIVLPEGQSVTLAAQRAEIPITVENLSDGDRSVMLMFDSDKLGVLQDRSIVVLPPGVSTIDIELEARSLGWSPLRIRILTADGTTELSRTSYGVRSTAIPGLGLLLSAAALVFLLAWWIVSFTKSRAQKAHPSNTPSTPPSDVKISL